jgi:hypothetical protein
MQKLEAPGQGRAIVVIGLTVAFRAPIVRAIANGRSISGCPIPCGSAAVTAG